MQAAVIVMSLESRALHLNGMKLEYFVNNSFFKVPMLTEISCFVFILTHLSTIHITVAKTIDKVRLLDFTKSELLTKLIKLICSE